MFEYLFAKIGKMAIVLCFCTAKLRIKKRLANTFFKYLRVAYQQVSKRIGRVSKRIEYADFSAYVLPDFGLFNPLFSRISPNCIQMSLSILGFSQE